MSVKRLYYIALQRVYTFFQRKRSNDKKAYMIHKISEEQDIYSISKKNFLKLIEIHENEFITIEELVKGTKGIVLTFDDAFDSVYYLAHPVLKDKGIPYYIFICNEFINKQGYLSKKMIHEILSYEKCYLGSHSYYHKLSREMSKEAFRESLEKSKLELERDFSRTINYYAFPYGSLYACSNINVKEAKNLFDYIFTTIPIPYCVDDHKVIPRFNINDKFTVKD